MSDIEPEEDTVTRLRRTALDIATNKTMGAMLIAGVEADHVREFIERHVRGNPKYLAGAAVGMSPAEVDEVMKLPGMKQMIAHARELALDGIEALAWAKAEAGHNGWMEKILAAYRPETWAEKKGPETSAGVKIGQINVIHGTDVVHALQQMTAEDREAGIAALQAHAVNATAIEATGTEVE